MCGIFMYYGKEAINMKTFKDCLSTLKNRGPEKMQVYQHNRIMMGFTRLAINELSDGGMQPMFCDNRKIAWICNGEIYNWKELRSKYELYTTSNSDCSIIGPLYKRGQDKIKEIDGVFALVLYNKVTDTVVISRDTYGVRPLFLLKGLDYYAVSSELKAFTELPKHLLHNVSISIFEPGNILIDRNYIFSYKFTMPIPLPSLWSYEIITKMLASYLRNAVYKRVDTTERAIACLLSGGLDSSLIASLVQERLKQLDSSYLLETYSIGFKGSPDLKHARLVAEHIGSKHHELELTPDDFFNAIPEVIKDIESYDITTVRASVGNWLICKFISEHSSAKVVFNGDGADEVFGSYLYMKKAPSEFDFISERNRLVSDIHYFDVLRSDRSISSHGLEARTPFLDKTFVSFIYSLPNSYLYNSNIEKWILRQSFVTDNLLPNEVLSRRKEAFSDGVSSNEKSWYEEIQERLSSIELSSTEYKHLPPPTKEARYYRDLFETFYPNFASVIPYYWMPKWSEETSDPSARTLEIY